MPINYLSAGYDPINFESRRGQSDTAEGMGMRPPRKMQPEGSKERLANRSPLRATAEQILTTSPAFTRNFSGRRGQSKE